MERLGDPLDYYQVLGVPRTATLDEIRAAFRERAKVFHPDHGGTRASDAAFKKIAEAYAVLRDPQQRAAYDLDAQRAINETIRRQGRWQRAGSAAGRPEAVGRPGLLQPAIILVLAIVAAGMAGLWWVTSRQVGMRDRELSQVYDRLQAVAQRSLPVPAKPATAIIEPTGDTRLAGQPIFQERLDLGFHGPDRAARLSAALEEVTARLVGAAEALVDQESWVVLIDGTASVGSIEDGAIVEAWENAGFGLGSVVEYLTERGVPSGRVVGRLQVDMLAAGEGRSDARLVEIKLLCCAAGKH